MSDLSHRSEDDPEPPGVPGFDRWPRLYAFVLGTFVVVVALLALFSRYFA